VNENNCQPILFYTLNLSFTINGKTKSFQDKHNLKKILISKPALQKILKGILNKEEEAKQIVMAA
jgi:hypothetical protein